MLDAVLLERQDPGVGHGQGPRELLLVDDLGRLEEILPFVVFGLLRGGELSPEPAPGPQDDQEQYGKHGFFHGHPLPISYSDGLECRTAGLACQPASLPGTRLESC